MLMRAVWAVVLAVCGALLLIGARADGADVPLGTWSMEGVVVELAPRRDQALQRMLSTWLNSQGLPVTETPVCLVNDVVMDARMPKDTVGYASASCIVFRKSWQLQQWPPSGADVEVRIHELLHTIREVHGGYGWWPAVDRDIAERAVQAAAIDLRERFVARTWPNSLNARLVLMDGYEVGWVRAASARASGSAWWASPARSWRYALVREDRWGRRAMLRAAGVVVP